MFSLPLQLPKKLMGTSDRKKAARSADEGTDNGQPLVPLATSCEETEMVKGAGHGASTALPNIESNLDMTSWIVGRMLELRTRM